MAFLWSLGSFLIAIGVLVAVHEYGHFWAARKCGIKIHRFSIGFGKVLWKRTDKHGTEFALSLVPLGGYVKMLDGRNETVPPELASQAFENKTVWQRAFVIAAGPFANFLFAVLAYWAVFVIGMPTTKPVIGNVLSNSIAAQAQLQPDMQIIAVDGSATPDWESVNLLLASKLGNGSVVLTVKPMDSAMEQHRVLDLTDWQFEPDKQSAFGALGIVPVRPKVVPVLSVVADNSPAQRAGLQVGDEILPPNPTALSVSAEAIWRDFGEQAQRGMPFEVRIKRHDDIFNVTLTPEKNSEGRWLVGVSPTVYPIGEEYRTELKYDMLSALWKGAEKTAQLSWLTVKVIGKLFSGDLSPSNLSGPISIAKGAGATANIGLVYFLSFMALISVNLGIMNLFPLPVLDGGHLVFLAAEVVKGKPVSERVQNVAYRIGAFLLLLLMAFALFNDFLRF